MTTQATPRIHISSKLRRLLFLLVIALSGLVMAGQPGIAVAQTMRDDDETSIKYETTFYDLVPLGSCGDAAGSEAVSLEGKDNIQKAFNYFIGKKLTPIQSAGILGNLRQESGVNPKSDQKDGPGRGIAQWSEGGRWEALKNWAKSRDIYSLQTQLDFIWHEMTDVPPWKETLPAMKAANNIEDAVRAFEQKYEKAGKPVYTNRIKYAKETLAAFGGATPSNESPGEASACGGTGIAVDGYSFPVAPQTQRNYTTLPCKEPTAQTVNYKGKRISTCHHDGTPAFDLMYNNVGGKAVYAITKGKVVRINNSYVMNSAARGKPCGSLQFKADNGTDQSYYWYGHVLVDPQLRVGREYKEGTVFGKVATSGYGPKCWGGGEHLHIDRGCIEGKTPKQGGSDDCRDPAFLQDLQKIWEGLPKS
jgi:hypothetical protein